MLTTTPTTTTFAKSSTFVMAADWAFQNFLYLRSLLYDGIDHTIPGNGGMKCYNFLTINQRLADTVSYLIFLCFGLLPVVLRKLKAPKDSDLVKNRELLPTNSWRHGKKILLIALCLTFGIELGYKLSTKQLLYLLNPCHIITSLQIYFLIAEESKHVLILFRVHIHILFGAFLAIIFPVVNTRVLPGELAIYWIQHILIFFVIPPYLISKGGCFTPEPMRDFSMALLALVVFATHMFVVLQAVGMLTLANLNSMLCPAVSDPFYGPYYRWFAIVHQSTLVLFFGKIYTYIVLRCIKLLQRMRTLTKTE